jgi:hypothetical protein
MVKNMSLISKCASFPPDEVFYIFSYESLQSVSDFQKEIDSIPQEYAIHPRSFHGALCTVAACGNVPVAKKIVEIAAIAKKILFEYGDCIGRTPLIWAIVKGQHLMAKYLISVKADVNTASQNGSTPLWYATKLHRASLAELLLDNGAEAEPKSNKTEIHIIERAQEALDHEKNIQAAFLRSLFFLLAKSISGSADVHRIIVDYADPLMKGQLA